MFTLDSRLEKDCFLVKELGLSKLLLMNDSNYFWLILVPKKENIVELIDLEFEDQITLLKEVNQLSNILKNEFSCDKINVASLGNVAKQLHMHVIGRFNDDISFPNPVWGSCEAKSYEKDAVSKLINKITNLI